MKHEVDLSKYSVRTDLAIDVCEKDFINNIYDSDGISVSSISLDGDMASSILKKPGNYITISFLDVTDSVNKDKVKLVFCNQLINLFKRLSLIDNVY